MLKVNNYNWDLEDILKNEAIEILLQKWEKQMDHLIKIYPTIFTTYKNFVNWLKEGEKFQILSNRLSNYISNKNNENLKEEIWIALKQQLVITSNKFTTITSDYENRILDNEKIIKEFLENKEINEYSLLFDDVFRGKPYILEKNVEKILAELEKTTNGVDEMFSALIDSDIKFQDAIDSKQRKHTIPNHSAAILLLKHQDRTLRKSAWINFNKAFYDFRTTLTYALYNNYLSLNTYAKVRKHQDYIAATCYSDHIDTSLIKHIYQNVKNYANIYQSFKKHRHKLLKQLLNVSKIEPWDLNMDLSSIKINYEIPEAKQIVLAALKPMGEEYLGVVKKALNENWISWLPNENKYSGAYSIGGTKGLDKYYILMNYDKTLNSIFTLVHELGHSLNSYYYTKKQKIYSSTTIFCAEVASITNEMLLNYHLLEKYKNDTKKRLVILDELLNGFFATTTRQIIFSNFEYKINEAINCNKAITFSLIADTYIDLMDEYMGLDEKNKFSKTPYQLITSTPLRIPHFYAGNFYVYKYAIGQVVGCIVAKKIISKEPGFIEKYIDFLSSGTSKEPLDTIKILGIDLNEDTPWEIASQIIEEFLNEYKNIEKI